MNNFSFIHVTEADNVAVATAELPAGALCEICGRQVTTTDNIPAGHKFAICNIPAGQSVIKYANSIGVAKVDIAAGSHVHSHNLASDIAASRSYSYEPVDCSLSPDTDSELKFMGYRRSDGRVGVRNEIWIVPTVGCVNDIADELARCFGAELPDGIDAIRALNHPFGCSQTGGDHQRTAKLLASLCKHPNAAGVLVLGLGCENNQISHMREMIGDFDPRRIKFLNCQDCEDEIAEAENLLRELGDYACSFKREACDISELVIGLKCGGSDGFSGLSANPLVGRFCDKIISCGGSALLSETPEMFGAEHILMSRCQNEATFNKCVKMIQDFKDFFTSHGEGVDENPSPGNKDGGITTLAEKSLGCITKAGSAPVVDVLDYAGAIKQKGLSLLAGPGNDIVAVTNLIAAGAHIVLFTTGRGTPLSGPAPTIKIATNSPLAKNKKRWIDFNAGEILDDKSFDSLAKELFKLVIDCASGEYFTTGERHHHCQIAIFHDGVTL